MNRITAFDKYIDENVKLKREVIARKDGTRQLLRYAYTDKNFKVDADSIDVLFEEYMNHSEDVLIQFSYISPELGTLVMHIQDRDILHWITETDKDKNTIVTIRFRPNDFEREGMIKILEENKIPGKTIYFRDDKPEEGYIDLGEINSACIIRFTFNESATFDLSEIPVSFPASDGDPEHSQPGYLTGLTVMYPFNKVGGIHGDNNLVYVQLGIGSGKSLFSDEHKKNYEDSIIDEGEDMSPVNIKTDDDLRLAMDEPNDKNSPEYLEFVKECEKIQLKSFKWSVIFESTNPFICKILREYSQSVIPKEELLKDPSKSIDYQAHIDDFEAFIKENYPDKWLTYDSYVMSGCYKKIQEFSLSSIPNITEIVNSKDIKAVIDECVKCDDELRRVTKKIYQEGGFNVDGDDNICINNPKDEVNSSRFIQLKEKIKSIPAAMEANKAMERLTSAILNKAGFTFKDEAELKASPQYALIYLSIPSILDNYRAGNFNSENTAKNA